MIHFLLSLLLPLSFALTPPVIKKTNVRNQAQVVLGDDVVSALTKWNPHFKVFSIQDYPATVFELFADAPNELPMAVIGDFNGDKIPDVALMGRDTKNEHIVILLANKTKFDVVVVQTKAVTEPQSQKLYNEQNEEEKGLTSYLGLVKAQGLKFKNADISTKIKMDALELETYGAASKVLYLKKTKKASYEVKEYTGSVD